MIHTMKTVLVLSVLLAVSMTLARFLLSRFVKRPEPAAPGASGVLFIVVRFVKYAQWLLVGIILISGFMSTSNVHRNEEILRNGGWDIPSSPPLFDLGRNFKEGYRRGASEASFSAHGAADGGRCDFDLPMLPPDTARLDGPIPRGEGEQNPPCVAPRSKKGQ
jgi:hypothetical protein